MPWSVRQQGSGVDVWQEISRSRGMAMILKDILVDIKHADFLFDNPLTLMDEKGDTIGYAELLHRSNQLYATLYIDADEGYTDRYPKAVIEGDKISSIVLSVTENKDVRIEKVSDQEIIHSSAGAENADMK